MRHVLGLLIGAAILTGCTSASDDPTPIGVTTPPASATVGPTVPPATTPPQGTTPAPTTAPTTAQPPPAETPLAAYRGLVATWQAARARFFRAVSDGQPRTAAQQRALAAAYLAEHRALARGLSRTRWPAGAGPAVRELLAANAAQAGPLAGMAAAGSRGEFTARLADYGVGAARENRAVAAVERALR